MAQHRDPICGMQIDEENAAGKSEHGGRTYYFCSAGCKTKFDENPEQYAGQGQTGGGQDAA